MNEVFRSIMLPVDFSQKGEQAVSIALKLARDSGARVKILHVVEEIAGVAKEEVAELYGTLRKNAQARIDEIGTRFGKSGVDAEVEVVIGKPGKEIVRRVIDGQFDLLVLRSHCIDPQNPETPWGTLSYQVSLVCPCPVLLVK